MPLGPHHYTSPLLRRRWAVIFLFVGWTLLIQWLSNPGFFRFSGKFSALSWLLDEEATGGRWAVFSDPNGGESRSLMNKVIRNAEAMDGVAIPPIGVAGPSFRVAVISLRLQDDAEHNGVDGKVPTEAFKAKIREQLQSVRRTLICGSGTKGGGGRGGKDDHDPCAKSTRGTDDESHLLSSSMDAVFASRIRNLAMAVVHITTTGTATPAKDSRREVTVEELSVVESTIREFFHHHANKDKDSMINVPPAGNNRAANEGDHHHRNVMRSSLRVVFSPTECVLSALLLSKSSSDTHSKQPNTKKRSNEDAIIRKDEERRYYDKVPAGSRVYSERFVYVARAGPRGKHHPNDDANRPSSGTTGNVAAEIQDMYTSGAFFGTARQRWLQLLSLSSEAVARDLEEEEEVVGESKKQRQPHHKDGETEPNREKARRPKQPASSILPDGNDDVQIVLGEMSDRTALDILFGSGAQHCLRKSLLVPTKGRERATKNIDGEDDGQVNMKSSSDCLPFVDATARGRQFPLIPRRFPLVVVRINRQHPTDSRTLSGDDGAGVKALEGEEEKLDAAKIYREHGRVVVDIDIDMDPHPHDHQSVLDHHEKDGGGGEGGGGGGGEESSSSSTLIALFDLCPSTNSVSLLFAAG